MTNGEKYKTLKQRVVAFRNHCKAKGYCAGCNFPTSGDVVECAFRWLDNEYRRNRSRSCVKKEPEYRVHKATIGYATRGRTLLDREMSYQEKCELAIEDAREYKF